MQFQVPQFIETEDKVVGPFTLRQFVYVAIAGVLGFTLFFVLKLWLWFIIVIILFSVSASVAFIKINGRPMAIFIQSAFSYIWSPRIYTLKPGSNQPVINRETNKIEKRTIPVLGGIKSLLEKMNTSKDAVPKRERTIAPVSFILSQKEIKERYEVIRRGTGEREMARRIDYR